MKTHFLLLPILYLAALCGVSFGAYPLTGIDIYAVASGSSAASMAFSFENYHDGKVVRGMRSAVPLLTRHDIHKAELSSVELGGAPLDLIRLTFKPEAKAKLVEAVKMQSSDVLIEFCGKPRATISIKEIIKAINQHVPIVLAHPVTDFDDIISLDVILKKIMAGTWTPPKK